MRKKIIITYSALFFVTAAFIVYYFLFNIYGSEIIREPENLFADNTSEMMIKIIPVNSLGWKVLFRHSSAVFNIVEGEDLIETIQKNEKEGMLRIRSLGKEGLVGIKIKSEHSLLTEYIEVKIIPLITEILPHKN